MDTAEESTEKSQNVAGIIQSICDFLGLDVEVVDGPVRKTAHFCEFALLGALAYITAKQFRLGISSALLYSLLVAVFDETLQCFSPERFSSTADVLLDFCGALFGVLCLFIIIKLRKKNTSERAVR